MVNNYSHNKIILFDIDHTIFDTQKFYDTKLAKYSLHKDVKQALDKILQIAEIGIFSEGEKNFQYKKLEKTNILKKFNPENIFIAKNKMEIIDTILEKYANKKIYLVDDKLTVLHMIQQTDPKVVTIWMKRGYYAQKQDIIPNYIPNFIIYNLSELIQIICPLNSIQQF